jgi:hypothetical protein
MPYMLGHAVVLRVIAVGIVERSGGRMIQRLRKVQRRA